MEELRLLFSNICGQEHCWELGGVTLPFCQRCTGLYVGALCALLLVLWFRPRPRARVYWLHGGCMLAMIPFGFHLVAHGGMMRTLTGAVFSLGLVYFLALNPLTAWDAWRETGTARLLAYLGVMALAVAALLAWIRVGGAGSGVILTGLGVLGLAALILLTATNFVLLAGMLRERRFQRGASPQ